MRFAYYPGCSLHSTAKDYNMSAKAVCKAIGIELVEIPDWNCCGATSAHATNKDISFALPLRNLAIAEEMGLDITAPCAACYGRLKAANAALANDAELLSRINDIAGANYKVSINVLSLLEAVYKLGADKIKSLVKNDLSEIKPAAYYGCLLLRPPDVTKFDDAENPTSMDVILESIGTKPVSWPYKTECCGAGLSISKSDIVLKLTHEILNGAKKSGANCIVVACPLCQSNLDSRQTQVESKYEEYFGLPVFYFTQLMGLAFGIPQRELGLKKLMVNPNPIISKIGFKDK